MNKYTIYCTEDQTRKALELGAQIEIVNQEIGLINKKYFFLPKENTRDIYAKVAILPTAEQMIGWLEEQGIKINIEHSDVEDSMRFKIHKSKDFDYIFAKSYHFLSRKEATIAAIDAALEYLSNNNKQ